MTGARPAEAHEIAPDPRAGLPIGFRVRPDADAREVRPGVWFGGRPARVLRLRGAGAAAWGRLVDGAPVDGPTSGRVARAFVDAGLAHPVPPALDLPIDLTVVVPVHGRLAELDRCLGALDGAFPVLVVDDASPDEIGVRRCVERHGATVLRLVCNAGPAGARNHGLAQVHTALVAFVDSDTEPAPDALRALAAHLADPAVGAAAPRIVTALSRVDPAPDLVFPPGAVAFGAGKVTTRGGMTGFGRTGSSTATRYAAARGSLDLGTRPAGVAPYTPVSYVPTAALVVRTAALREVGDFDPALRYGEDVDLVWRLAAAGHRVRYDPTVTVTHHDPVGWRGLFTRRFRYGTSAAPLAARHPANLAPVLVAPWYTATVAALLAGRPVLAGAAFAGTVRAGRRALARSGVEREVLRVRDVAGGVVQAGFGIARCAGQFGAPLLIAAAVPCRTRSAALALLLAPALREWWVRRPALDPVRFTAAVLADDLAYGAGVIAGCATHRTTVPLRPVRARRTARGDE